MNAEITMDTTEHDIPYVEISMSPDRDNEPGGDYWITFRKYPRRVFVGVEDYRGDMSSGADLEDCWSAPIYIIEKTLIENFNPHEALKRAFVYLGEIEYYPDPDEQFLTEWNIQHFEEEYESVKDKISEWEAV